MKFSFHCLSTYVVKNARATKGVTRKGLKPIYSPPSVDCFNKKLGFGAMPHFGTFAYAKVHSSVLVIVINKDMISLENINIFIGETQPTG